MINALIWFIICCTFEKCLKFHLAYKDKWIHNLKNLYLKVCLSSERLKLKGDYSKQWSTGEIKFIHKKGSHLIMNNNIMLNSFYLSGKRLYYKDKLHWKCGTLGEGLFF